MAAVVHSSPTSGEDSRKAAGGVRDMANEVARSLRKRMTPREVNLWCQLRYLNAQGFHFRRQAPMEGFIVDFLERKRRLVIEVDGSQHGFSANEIADRKRDAVLNNRGYIVLRFWNSDVDRAMDGVIDKILENIHRPLPSAPQTPSPEAGEG